MNLNHLKRKLVSGLLAGTLLLGMTSVSTVNAATASASDYLKQMNQVIQSVDVSMLTNAKIIDKNYTLNNKKVMKISAELTGSSLKKAMKNLLKMDGLPQDEEVQKLTEQLLDFSKVKPVKYIYYIDPKTNLPVKCTADMKDFLDTYMQSMLTNLLNSDLMKTEETTSMDIKVNVTKANMSITYTDYNQTKEIKFPSSCK